MTVNGHGGCLLPGDNYPDWLTFNCKGSSVIFEVPQVEGRKLKTMMCIVYSSTPDNIASNGLKIMLVINHTKATIQLYKREALASFENEKWQRVVSNIEPSNKVEIVVVFGNGFIVKKTAIYLIYDESIGKKMVQCHGSDKNVIVCSDDENECAAWVISPQVESTDDLKRKQKEENSSGHERRYKNGWVKINSYDGCKHCIGAASCGGLIKYSFRQWITGFTCRLVATNALVSEV